MHSRMAGSSRNIKVLGRERHMFQIFKRLPAAPKTHNFSDRKRRIFRFLRANPVGVLSTVTPDGNPHGVVIYFHTTPEFAVSFLTKTGTRKYDNIIHDDHVMLTVFEAETQAVAQITGRAEELHDSTEIHALSTAILTISAGSEAGTPPITKLLGDRFTAFTIRPLQIRMAVYDRPDSGGYDTLFESIESFEMNPEEH